MALGTILNILDWLKNKLPIPNRLEGIKNEIDKLEKERTSLLSGGADVKKAKRIIVINDRLDKLAGMLKNATGNS